MKLQSSTHDTPTVPRGRHLAAAADLRGSRQFFTGMLHVLPFVPSSAVLGSIFGASASAAGLGSLTPIVMSALVFSGSGQFAALPLWRAAIWVIALNTLVLSLRFSLMTVSMAPRVARWPYWLRALVAYGVTDENYALAVTRRSGAMEPAYLAGSGLALYCSWLGGTILGVLIGSHVPAAWKSLLDAVFPIVFLTLTVLCCTTRPAVLVALLAGGLSVAGALVFPAGGWHVILAGLIASAVGPLSERWFSRRTRL